MADNVPLLGSKISLISRADVRYEGTLYTIDPNEATVALSNVRSIGTEDRLTEHPIAARDEVFEYIIFRGSDIKDLHVCEAPIPQSIPNQDPAIVKFSQSGTHLPTFFPTCVPGFRGKATMYPRPAGGQRVMKDQGVQTYNNNKYHNADMGWQVGRFKQSPHNQYYQQGNGFIHHSGGREFNNSRSGGSSGGRNYSNRGRKRMLNHCDIDFSSKFEGEFDFEFFNAQFDKHQLEKEIHNKLKLVDKKGKDGLKEDNKEDVDKNRERDGEEEDEYCSGPEQGCYDRSKSFFDHISTADKTNRRRFTWKDEKRLNMETFGLKMVTNQQVLRRFHNRPSFAYNNFNHNSFSNNYHAYNNYSNHHFNNSNNYIPNNGYKNHPNNYKHFPNNYNNSYLNNYGNPSRGYDTSRQPVCTSNLRAPAVSFVPKSHTKKGVKIVEMEKEKGKKVENKVDIISTPLTTNHTATTVLPVSEASTLSQQVIPDVIITPIEDKTNESLPTATTSTCNLSFIPPSSDNTSNTSDNPVATSGSSAVGALSTSKPPTTSTDNAVTVNLTIVTTSPVTPSIVNPVTDDKDKPLLEVENISA